MKGLVFYGNEILKWEDVPDVTPKDNEVKIKIKAAGICGSDVHGYQGITGRRIPPMIMGHEFSGIVVEVGKNVKNIKVNDRVAPFPVDYCGECEYCRRGDVQLCPTRRQFGVLKVDGAFAEYLCVPEKVCFKLADSVSYSAGSTIEPLAVATRAVKHAGNLEGKNVLVVGTGPIGLMVIACVKAQNAAKIFVSDLSDNRLQVAKQIGADLVINPTKEDLKEKILTNTGNLGVDVSFEAVGVSATCKQAMLGLRIGGLSVWIGQGSPLVEIGMLDIVTRELKIFGTFTYGLKEFEKAVNMLNMGIVDVTPIITKEAPMSQGAQWFENLKKPDNLVKVILIDKE
jgi:threonine dehydrogenase-like Zn-dependent dehydrogenase